MEWGGGSHGLNQAERPISPHNFYTRSSDTFNCNIGRSCVTIQLLWTYLLFSRLRTGFSHHEPLRFEHAIPNDIRGTLHGVDLWLTRDLPALSELKMMSSTLNKKTSKKRLIPTSTTTQKHSKIRPYCSLVMTQSGVTLQNILHKILRNSASRN